MTTTKNKKIEYNLNAMNNSNHNSDEEGCDVINLDSISLNKNLRKNESKPSSDKDQTKTKIRPAQKRVSRGYIGKITINF